MQREVGPGSGINTTTSKLFIFVGVSAKHHFVDEKGGEECGGKRVAARQHDDNVRIISNVFEIDSSSVLV